MNPLLPPDKKKHTRETLASLRAERDTLTRANKDLATSKGRLCTRLEVKCTELDTLKEDFSSTLRKAESHIQQLERSAKALRTALEYSVSLASLSLSPKEYLAVVAKTAPHFDVDFESISLFFYDAMRHAYSNSIARALKLRRASKETSTVEERLGQMASDIIEMIDRIDHLAEKVEDLIPR